MKLLNRQDIKEAKVKIDTYYDRRIVSYPSIFSKHKSKLINKMTDLEVFEDAVRTSEEKTQDKIAQHILLSGKYDTYLASRFSNRSKAKYTTHLSSVLKLNEQLLYQLDPRFKVIHYNPGWEITRGRR